MALDAAGHPARAPRQRARRVAALRLSRLESDRHAAVGRGPRRPPHDAPLVLPDSAGGRTARPRARDRAPQSRRAAGPEDGLRPPRAARGGAHRAAARASRASRWSIRPECAIPYVSRVDAGTAEAVKARGVEIVSSGDLVQAFEAVWTPAQLESHRVGVAGALPDQGPGLRRRGRGASASGAPLTEYELQQQMVAWFAEEGLVVGLGAGRGRRPPRRRPALPAHRGERVGHRRRPAAAARPLGQAGTAGRRVCRYHVGRVHRPRRAGAHGRGVRRRRPGARYRGGPGAGRRAGRAATCGGGKWTGRRGPCWSRPGSRPRCLHRTGHSLGESVHGNGAHLDDFETHDDRRLLPGTGFTVEPGVYLDDFGVRTEINVFSRGGPARPRAADQAPVGHGLPIHAVFAMHRTAGRGGRNAEPEDHVALFAADRADVGARRHDHRVAARSVAADQRADGGGAADEQRAAHRCAHGVDLPRHRQAGVAGGGEHPHRVAAAHAGPVRLLRRRRRRRPLRALLRPAEPARPGPGPGGQGGGQGQQRRASASRSCRRPAPASSSTRPGFILTNNHVVDGATKIAVSLYGEDEDQEYDGARRRPRPAHRQRAHRAHREAQPHAARDQVRRFERRCSRATG